jgi:PPOX class probable FMN-dependent enzyme
MEIPWLQPFRAAAASEPGRPTIIALATVDAAGDPQVRSVVCRRIDDDGRLWITSDARSAKHDELVHRPRAAAVAWFPATREQFRFNGGVRIIDSNANDPAAEKIWRDLPPATRAMFYWPPPGQPRAPADAFVESADATEPPASFEVLVLQPDRVEHLSLAVHPHQRRRWDWDADWWMEELNP